jgi:hypothetical protein
MVAAAFHTRETVSADGRARRGFDSRQTSKPSSTSNNSRDTATAVSRVANQRLNSLAGSYPLRIAASRSISATTASVACAAVSGEVASTFTSIDVPSTFSK